MFKTTKYPFCLAPPESWVGLVHSCACGCYYGSLQQCGIGHQVNKQTNKLSYISMIIFLQEAQEDIDHLHAGKQRPCLSADVRLLGDGLGDGLSISKCTGRVDYILIIQIILRIRPLLLFMLIGE